MLSLDELNLDRAPEDINNEEFQVYEPLSIQQTQTAKKKLSNPALWDYYIILSNPNSRMDCLT